MNSFPYSTTISANKEVHLTAVPAPGYVFVGWTGASTATSETLTVVMSCEKVLTANFVLVKYELNTIIEPAGTGEITLQPAQPADGYAAGTRVTLRAKPAAKYSFVGWSGNASGSLPTVIITIDSDKTVVASFAETTPGVWAWILGGVGALALGVLIYTGVFRR